MTRLGGTGHVDGVLWARFKTDFLSSQQNPVASIRNGVEESSGIQPTIRSLRRRGREGGTHGCEGGFG